MMLLSPARLSAARILKEIIFDGAYSNLALKELPDNLSLSDRALVTSLVYGTLEHYITIDWMLSQISKPKRTRPFAKIVIWQSAYELLWEHRPAYAVMSQAGMLIGRFGLKSLGGYVQWCLSALMQRSIPLPVGSDPEALSVRCGVPTAISEAVISSLGSDLAESVLTAERDDFVSLTCGLQAPDWQELQPSPVPGGYRMRSASLNGNVYRSYYEGGCIFPQGSCSRLAVRLLNPQPGERILDLCSAPGGKSLAAAVMMQNSGEILACELHEHRTELVRLNAQRMGINIIKTLTVDSTALPSEVGEFDRVICDVPCSGLGVLRKKPDIRLRYAPDASLYALQLALAESAYAHLKRGGVMLYSTCTVLREENNAVVEKLLSLHSDLHTLGFEVPFKHISDEYGTTILPGEGADGFFIALLKKN